MALKIQQATPRISNSILLFALLLLFVQLPLITNASVETIIPSHILEKIEKPELYDSKQWKRLLHFKNGKSEIDDPTFFLSKEGKTNLKAELKASVIKLLTDKTDTKDSTQCYYPSRSDWIIKQLPSLETLIKKPKCEALKKELDALSVKQATLVLASAHINSPASAFGHTFMRLDSSDDTALASFSVNYAAETDETNGLLFAYKGLFGKYRGRYSVEAYSQRVEKYSNIEQRDIWEYPLDLNADEIERLILHILEIRNFYADYFFLSENCSYNLLWLIEIAKENVNLTNQFGAKAIPIDTLRAVADAQLVKGEIYRPSRRTKILTKNKEVSHLPQAKAFAKSDDYDLDKLNGLSDDEKARTLELSILLLQAKQGKNKISLKEFRTSFIKLLNERSKLGVLPELEIPQPTSPKKGHKSSKVTLSYDDENNAEINFKVAYHDIYDNESGFIPGAYINFLDTSIKIDGDKASLDEIDIINIQSYALQNSLLKPVSWQVRLGAKRVFDNELNPFLQFGAGITKGNETLFTYATLTPTLYYSDTSDVSISTNVGVIYNPSSTIKFGLTASNEWFDNGQRLLTAEPFITYTISRNIALNLRYEYKALQDNSEKENTTTLSLFKYF